MSAGKVFQQFFAKLAKSLPMDDVIFVAELFSRDLLPGDHYDQVESKPTRAHKAVYFLNHVIKPAISIDAHSFNVLLDVMEDSEYCNVKEFAQQIKSELKTNADNMTDLCSESIANLSMEEPPAKKTKESTTLDDAADGLRSRYLGQLPTAKADWPKHFVTSYIQLALVEKQDITNSSEKLDYITTLTLRGGVDRILKKKHPIYDLREIFHYNDEPIPRLTLIMGGPGIGKTTMANEICVQWARDGFLSEDFNIVIMITLRTVQQRSIEDVVIKLIGLKAYQLLKESLGAKCLIILEGLDEMATEQQQNDLLLMELVKDVPTEFVKTRIVITSRPNACQELKANRTIEIIGLGDNEIMEFVQNSFPDDTRSVKAFSIQLDEYPQLYSLCYVPMSLVMIVRIFRFTQQSLPSTLTELYRVFIVMSLIREEKKKLITKCLVSTTVVDAAEEILCEVFADIPSKEIKIVLALCKLAYFGFFEWHRERGRGKTLSNQKEAKIIFTENDLMQSGIEVTDHYDGHGLLQVETLYQLTGDCLTYNFVHLTVQEFLCAVYMLTLSQEEQCHLLKEYFNVYPNIMILYCGLSKIDFRQVVYSKLASRDSTVTAVKCLYEGQQTTSTASYKSTSPLVLNTSHTTLLGYDILCLSYVFCGYPVQQLNMLDCHIGDKNVGILAKCLDKEKTTVLQELNLSGNNITSEGMKHVMAIVTSSPSLRVLDVSWNNIGDDGISLCLQHVNTLTELNVTGCELSVEGAGCIKSMLMENSKLQCFYISSNKIGDDGVRLITEGLQYNNTLIKLEAYRCDFSIEGATCIKNMLMENKKLQHLSIDSNQFGDDGVRLVAEGLHHNDTLTELRLHGCKISVKGTTHVKKLLMENKRLQHLNIGSNKIGDDGVRHITEGLHHNDTLTELMLHDCKISVKGAISISEMIKINCTLQVLNIRLNPIGDKGIAAITKSLDDARISELNVSRCKITITGAKSLAAGLIDNRSIRLLDVRYNDITVDGAVAILEEAVANGVCQEVIVDDKYKKDDKVKELLSILEERKRQEDGNKIFEDDHVMMATESHHRDAKVEVKDDQLQKDARPYLLLDHAFERFFNLMRTQRTIDKLFEESDMDTTSNGILAALSRAKTTIPLTTTPLPTITSASSTAPPATTKGGETTAEIGSSPDRFPTGGILPIAVETLLPSPPPLQQMGPVEISANLNSTHNSSSGSSSSSSSEQLTSSDSSYSLSSSYADDTNTGLDRFMLTSELNNAHASMSDSVVKSDHNYFKVLDPSVDTVENGDQPKSRKGRPRKYNVESPSSSKTQTKLTHFSKHKSTPKSDTPSSTSKSKTNALSTSKVTKVDKTPPPPRKYKRRHNCSGCVNCLKPDCGKCRNCLDKPKFGGRNTKKQRCVERICIHKESYDNKQKESVNHSKTGTTGKTPLSYSARKRSLSQITTPTFDKAADKATEPKPTKTPKLSITPTKLSTSTTVVSSADSKVTMATSEKKEYLTRTSRRDPNTPKVEEETELQFLLSAAPRTLRNQLAINMALPTKVAKKEVESPRKNSSSPVQTETLSSTRKSLRSSTLAATAKSINKTNSPGATALTTASTTTSTTVTTAQSSSKEVTSKGTASKDTPSKDTPSKDTPSKDTPSRPSTKQKKEATGTPNVAENSTTQLSDNFPSNIPADSTIITVPLLGGMPMEQWTVADVNKFLGEIKYQQYTSIFQHQEIDGQALVLLEVRDMVQTLNMKLGPALKLHRIIGLLKQK